MLLLFQVNWLSGKLDDLKQKVLSAYEFMAFRWQKYLTINVHFTLNDSVHLDNKYPFKIFIIMGLYGSNNDLHTYSNVVVRAMLETIFKC